MFGAFGDALARNCISFVSAQRTLPASKAPGAQAKVIPVQNIRKVRKRDMVRNLTPDIKVIRNIRCHRRWSMRWFHC
jgi:urease subunit alpha